MTTLIKILVALPLMVLFFDYAIAMQKVQPCGMRRALSTYSKETTLRGGVAIRQAWKSQTFNA